MLVLSLTLVLKQQFSKHINGKYQTSSTKNRTYYFFNDMINIKDFDPSLIKIEKKIIQKSWYLLYWIYHNEKY